MADPFFHLRYLQMLKLQNLIIVCLTVENTVTGHYNQ